MNCPQCSQSMPDGSKFCINCGAKIDAAPAPSQQTMTPQPTSYTPSNPTVPNPTPTPTQMTTPGQIQNPGTLTQPGTQSPGYVPFDNYQATSQRSWIERLVSNIPGYKGYNDKETRRDVDKLHREHLAAMLGQLKGPINGVIRELSDNRRLFETGPVERVTKKLDKIENRIRYASYGYTGFFDVVKIKEGQLDQIYQFDLALVNDVELIKTKVSQMVAQVSDANALKRAAGELEQMLDALDNKFNQRFQAIENPGWVPS
jgi:hypothetical protein